MPATAGSSACEKEFGTYPVPICHEWNTIAHLNSYEGHPEARPFTREELQRFLDYADEQVERAVRAKRKGALAAYRDATLFKVDLRLGVAADGDVEAGCRRFRAGTRRRRSSGGTACCNVRYGKAKKGQPPRRRNVLSVMDWAVEAVADYVENVRPRFGFDDHPALWVTERGGRIKPAEINARFVAYRDALKLPKALCPTRSGTRTSPTSPRTVLIGASSRSRSATSATVPRPSTPTSVTTS